MKPAFRSINNNISEFIGSSSILLLAGLLLVSIKGFGQGNECTNPPTITLSSNSGITCGRTPITISGNTFGGSATRVRITENGDGSVVPTSINVSPFSFTYTPRRKDSGKTITLTFTTDNPLGSPCTVARETFILNVVDNLSAPVVGTVIQPTCAVPTGSVVLNGLPAGNWIINPGGITGSTSSTTISGLAPGIYSFTVSNSAGCTSGESSDVNIHQISGAPAAPSIGAIHQPTCTESAGNVELIGLPSNSVWVITVIPSGINITGTGTSTIISELSQGTYTFAVTNSLGCTSSPSHEVTINDQPALPGAPVVGTITPPSCLTATGSVLLTGLPSSGSWNITSYPGTESYTGAGTSIIINDLLPGIYNYIVTSSAGCISAPSANVVIPLQPPTPASPVIGDITQPTFTVPAGSVELDGLPESGPWIITRLPDNFTLGGSGASYKITDLPGGAYTFTVLNSFGCISEPSDEVIIITPDVVVLNITDPLPVCYPETVDLTEDDIKSGSAAGLVYTYWLDQEASIEYSSPSEAIEGTYFIKGTNSSGYFDIKPVIVTVNHIPVPDAGNKQTLASRFSTKLTAELDENETGVWSVLTGSGELADTTDPETIVSGLSAGENILLWTVTNGVCPSASDQVSVIVIDLLIPTLITPNGDNINEYFDINGLESHGTAELVVFDRRGVQVFSNTNYDNKWNGVDYNKNPLPVDTYFFVLKTKKGISYSGYVVIRR